MPAQLSLGRIAKTPPEIAFRSSPSGKVCPQSPPLKILLGVSVPSDSVFYEGATHTYPFRVAIRARIINRYGLKMGHFSTQVKRNLRAENLKKYRTVVFLCTP
jgi:hypothetical protein